MASARSRALISISRSGPLFADQRPVRTCVGCRARAQVSELLRVAQQGGAIVPDPARRILGRGAYLHPDLHCFELAVRRKALPRALRLPAALPDHSVLEYLTSQHSAPHAVPSKHDDEGETIVSTP